ICTFLDAWRHDSETGPWWPQWITRDHLHTNKIRPHGPRRPSWCYGTPGISRAHQLAALSLGDTTRQHLAEHAIAACLSDPAQLALISDTGLCHGWAGLYQTAWRAAYNALTPAISTHLPHLADLLTHNADAQAAQADAGLLEGTAGLALALHTAALNEPLLSGWDKCMLIT
ncbi:MAG: lanthionine synthetase, partial [Actinobacteria bacterium]|nr:lanthionine synthetase [Actinomycetota bacterium]